MQRGNGSRSHPQPERTVRARGRRLDQLAGNAGRSLQSGGLDATRSLNVPDCGCSNAVHGSFPNCVRGADMNVTSLLIERIRQARKQAVCSPHSRYEIMAWDMTMKFVEEVQAELACKSLAEAGY